MTEMTLLTRPRRVARFVAALAAVTAGLFYVFFPPLTSIDLFNASWPARTWGVLFLIGGLVCGTAWWTRILVVDRLGLTFMIAGTAALTTTQTMQMINDAPSYTRGGGTFALWILVGYLVARWQDVRADEKEAKAAIEQTGGAGVGRR